MTTPPLPPRDLSLRDRADEERLRAELDRLTAENAALRTALAQAALPDSPMVRTLVRRRWIGGLASILLLVVAFALGAWYTRRVSPSFVDGFRDGWNAASATHADAPVVPPSVRRPVPARVPGAPSAPPAPPAP